MDPSDTAIEVPKESAADGTREEQAEALNDIIIAVQDSASTVQEINTRVQNLETVVGEVVTDIDALNTKITLDRQVQVTDNQILTGKIDALTKSLADLTKILRDGEDGPFGLSARNWARVKYLGVAGVGLLGFTANVMGVISFGSDVSGGNLYLRMLTKVHGKNHAVNDATRAVNAWSDQDEAAFWQQQAAYYVPAVGYSLETQIINAQMAIYVIAGNSRLNPVIHWSAEDKYAVVNGLTQTYLNEGSQAMYLSVTTYKHRDRVLPRSVALDCVCLALASVIVTLDPSRAAPSPNKLTQPDTSALPGKISLATDRAPKHMQPIFVFQKVLDKDLDIRSYAREVTLAWNGIASIQQTTDPAHNLFRQNSEHQAIVQKLQVDQMDAIVAKVSEPAARGNVQKLSDRFLEVCGKTFPLLPNETIVDDRIALLTAAYGVATPGSVAYLRATNKAEMVFVLPHVHLDNESGVPALVYGLKTRNLLSVIDDQDAGEWPEQVVFTGTRRRPRVRMDDQGGITDFMVWFSKYIGPVASTLSFAAPPPWGIVAAGAFQLIDEIFGSLGPTGPDLTQIVSQLLAETVKAIKALDLEEKVQAAVDSMTGFMVWIASAADDLNSLTSENTIWISNALATLQNASDPSYAGGVYSQLIFLLGPDVCTINDNNRNLNIAFLAATCLFLSYRLKCQLYALLAHFANENQKIEEYQANAAQFYMLLNDLQTSIATFSGKFNDLLANLTQARKNLVTEVQYYDDRQTVCQENNVGTASCWTEGNDGYTFVDNYSPPGPQRHGTVPNDRWCSGCCNQNDHCRTHEDAVQATRDFYMSVLSNQISMDYGIYTDTIARWASSLALVGQMMPPSQPPPPTVTAWVDGYTPSPDITGKKVRYLVEFADQKGPSVVSDGSDYETIVADKTPQLSLPVDASNVATKRNIYRQLMDASGNTTERVKVDVVADNTTVDWYDMLRD